MNIIIRKLVLHLISITIIILPVFYTPFFTNFSESLVSIFALLSFALTILISLSIKYKNTDISIIKLLSHILLLITILSFIKSSSLLIGLTGTYFNHGLIFYLTIFIFLSVVYNFNFKKNEIIKFGLYPIVISGFLSSVIFILGYSNFYIDNDIPTYIEYYDVLCNLIVISIFTSIFFIYEEYKKSKNILSKKKINKIKISIYITIFLSQLTTLIIIASQLSKIIYLLTIGAFLFNLIFIISLILKKDYKKLVLSITTLTLITIFLAYILQIVNIYNFYGYLKNSIFNFGIYIGHSPVQNIGFLSILKHFGLIGLIIIYVLIFFIIYKIIKNIKVSNFFILIFILISLIFISNQIFYTFTIFEIYIFTFLIASTLSILKIENQNYIYHNFIKRKITKLFFASWSIFLIFFSINMIQADFAYYQYQENKSDIFSIYKIEKAFSNTPWNFKYAALFLEKIIEKEKYHYIKDIKNKLKDASDEFEKLIHKKIKIEDLKKNITEKQKWKKALEIYKNS